MGLGVGWHSDGGGWRDVFQVGQETGQQRRLTIGRRIMLFAIMAVTWVKRLSMEYDEGNLILTEDERELLVFATMKEVEAQYPAPYFMGSLTEIKVEAEARIRLIQSRQDPVEGDQLRVSVLR